MKDRTFAWIGEPYVDRVTDVTILNALVDGKKTMFRISMELIDDKGMDQCRRSAEEFARSARKLPDSVLMTNPR